MSHGFKLQKLLTELPDFEDLDARAKNNPLGLIDHCRHRSKEYDEGVRWMHWCVLVALYAAAQVIKRDESLIAGLLKSPHFKERSYRPNSKDALRLVLLVGLDAPVSGRTYKKVCHEASLLKPFFEDDIDPSTLLSMIMASGGLKGLAEHYPAIGAEKHQQGEPNDPNSSVSAVAHNADGTGPSEQVEKVAKIPKIQPTNGSAPLDKEMCLVEVLLTRKRLDRLVHAPEGCTGTIVFEKYEGDPEARHLMATSIRIH